MVYRVVCNIQCRSRVKFIGGEGGAHHSHLGREVLGGSGGMLVWEIFNDGVSKIAFPAF